MRNPSRKSPCEDLALERRYVATVAMMSDLLDETALSPLDLADERCGLVYQAMLALKRCGKTVDVFTVLPELVAQGRVQRAGGEDFIRSLLAEAPVDARAAAEQLRELGRARRLREKLLRGVAACEKGLVDDARQLAAHAVDETAQLDPGERYATAYETAQHAWDVLVERPIDQTRMTHLGIPALDTAAGRVSPGSMVVIGARPGIGKSSVLYTMASEMAARGKRPGIVSVEDRKDVWGSRILGELSGVNPQKFRDRTFNDIERDCGEQALRRAKELDVQFAFEVSSKVHRVLSSMEFLVRQRGCDVLFVDYLQRIRGAHAESQRVMFGDIAGSLKDTSAVLDVPLILASQVKRGEKEYSEPTIGDLKETGAIEEIAEVIVLLWRRAADAKFIDARIAKVKWGPGRQRFQLARGEQGMLRQLELAMDEEPNPADFQDGRSEPQQQGIDWTERAAKQARKEGR